MRETGNGKSVQRTFHDALKSGEIKGMKALEIQANSDAIQAASQAATLPHIAAIEHETDAATLLARDLIQEIPSHHMAYLLAVILVRKVREDAPTVPAPVSAVDLTPQGLPKAKFDPSR